MDKNIPIDQNMIDYIFSYSESLHKVQKKILKFNDNLGKAKRLQISILQANFLQFLINCFLVFVENILSIMCTIKNQKI